MMLGLKRIVTTAVCILSLVALTAGCTPYQKGEGHLVSKQYKDAIAAFKEYVDQHPGRTEARARLAYAYLMDGQAENAIANYEIVLRENPRDMDSVIYLSLAYSQIGDVTRASEVLQKFDSKKNPQIAGEAKRQMTVMSIAASHQMAKKALEDEKRLGAPAVKPGSVAVLYFNDKSPDKKLGPMQKALAAMTIADLSKIRSISVLDRVRIQAMFDEMMLGQTGITDQATAPKVGRMLGAESVVAGNMFNPQKTLKVNVGLDSSNSGKSLGGFMVESDMEEFFHLQKDVVYNTVKGLGVKLTPEEEQAIAPFHTRSLKAVIYYGNGLEALDTGYWAEALKFFNMALKEDPYFLMALHGRDSTPSASTPSTSEISTTPLTSVVQSVTNSVSEAAAAGTPASSTVGGGVGGSGGSGGSSGGHSDGAHGGG